MKYWFYWFFPTAINRFKESILNATAWCSFQVAFLSNRELVHTKSNKLAKMRRKCVIHCDFKQKSHSHSAIGKCYFLFNFQVVSLKSFLLFKIPIVQLKCNVEIVIAEISTFTRSFRFENCQESSLIRSLFNICW